MPKQSQAVLLFSAALFAAALVPCLAFRPFFARFDQSAISLVTSLVWCSLPVFASVWSCVAARYLIRRRGGIGFWRGAVTGLAVLLGCALLWSLIMTTVTGNDSFASIAAVTAFALALFGILAAGVGGLAGWLTCRLLRDEAL